MRLFGRIIRGLVLALVMFITAIVFWLSLSPPALLLVGTGYAAKIVCSNVFLAGREPEVVLAWMCRRPAILCSSWSMSMWTGMREPLPRAFWEQ